MIRGQRPGQIRRRLRRLARGLADAIAARRSQPATGGGATGAVPATAMCAQPAAAPAVPAGVLAAAAPGTGQASWDAYEAWLEECAGVREAYESWATAPSADVRLAYAAYHAALDREEHASKYLQARAA